MAVLFSNSSKKCKFWLYCSLESFAAKTNDTDDLDQSMVNDLSKVELYLLKSHEMMCVREKVEESENEKERATVREREKERSREKVKETEKE